MTSNKRLIIRYAAFALALLVMIFIFSMSMQDSNHSASISGGVIQLVVRVVYRGFEELPKVEQADIIQSFQFIARKGAHFSIFAALGLCLAAGFFTFSKLRPAVRAAAAFVCGVLYAVSDEFHQYFVPGRSCELRDMAIDSSGVLLGCLFVSLVYLLYKKRKAKIKSK